MTRDEVRPVVEALYMEVIGNEEEPMATRLKAAELLSRLVGLDKPDAPLDPASVELLARLEGVRE